MNRSKISGWARVMRKAPSEDGRLDIYHRSGEDQWVDLALAYWQGKLNGLSVVKSSRSAIVHKGSLNQDSSMFYAKRFLVRDRSDWIKHMIKMSRAKRALIRGEEIQALGFSSPRALCLIEERRAGFVRESALITEAIHDASNIRDWLNRFELEVVNSIQRKRQLLRAFGHAVGTWHEARLYHGDMRTHNVLCRTSNAGFSFFWLDNERCLKLAWLPMRLRVHNLMQVNMDRRGITLTDRMRFWKAYLETTHIPPNQQKRIIWKVMRKTRKRWKKRGWI